MTDHRINDMLAGLGVFAAPDLAGKPEGEVQALRRARFEMDRHAELPGVMRQWGCCSRQIRAMDQFDASLHGIAIIRRFLARPITKSPPARPPRTFESPPGSCQPISS